MEFYGSRNKQTKEPLGWSAMAIGDEVFGVEF